MFYKPRTEDPMAKDIKTDMSDLENPTVETENSGSQGPEESVLEAKRTIWSRLVLGCCLIMLTLMINRVFIHSIREDIAVINSLENNNEATMLEAVSQNANSNSEYKPEPIISRIRNILPHSTIGEDFSVEKITPAVTDQNLKDQLSTATINQLKTDVIYKMYTYMFAYFASILILCVLQVYYFVRLMMK